MVNLVTRISELSTTLIDHHYTTRPEHVLHCLIPSFGLSDHNPTILIRKQNANLRSKKNNHITINYRCLKKIDEKILQNDFEAVPWSTLDMFSDDPDEMLKNWNSLVFTVIDKHAPIKSKRVKKQTKPAWFTEDIQNAIKRRDHLKKQVDLGKVPRDTYNSARNKVVHMIEKAKSESIKRELEDNSRNPRLSWKALKKLCPVGKSRSTDDHLNDASRNEHFQFKTRSK